MATGNTIYVGCGNGRDEGCGQIVKCRKGFRCECECGNLLRKGKKAEQLTKFMGD